MTLSFQNLKKNLTPLKWQKPQKTQFQKEGEKHQAELKAKKAKKRKNNQLKAKQKRQQSKPVFM